MSVEFNTLFTIGYESKNVDDFTETIQRYKIPLLIDVRNVPLSRKPGFSKTALADKLSQNKIEYLHLRELGAPKPIRYKYYENKNFSSFEKAYKRYLESTNGSLFKITELLKKTDACLLCFEQHAEECHRSILAEEIVKETQGKVKVEHL